MTHDEESQGYPTASGYWGADACPGSYRMEKGIPEEAPTADALFGIHVHNAIADGLNPDSLSEEERDVYERTQQRIRVILDQCGFSPTDPTERETRLWLSSVVSPTKKLIPPHLQISGKPDVVYMRPDRLLIVDAKSGRNTVALNHVNKQLRRLAVLCRRNFGVNEIWVAIAQPWAAHQPPCKYTATDLALAELEMWTELEEAMEPDAPLVAGPWCHYCRARAVCPRSTAKVLDVANSLAVVEDDKRLQLMPGPQLATMAEACTIAEVIIDAIKGEMKRRLAADPASVPGWALEPGDDKSTITDPQKAFEAVADKISAESYRACCTVWPGKLKKAWCEAVSATGKEKKAAIETLEKRLGPWLEKKQNQPSLEKTEKPIGETNA